MSWWIWNASVKEKEGSMRPFYGFMIQTNRAPGSHRSKPQTLPSGAILTMDEKIISDEAAESLLRTVEDASQEVDLSTLFTSALKITVRFRRRVLADAFAHTSIAVDCAYGLPKIEDLFPSKEDVTSLIDACIEELKLPFGGDFASHLGGFDIFRAPPHLDGIHPIRVELIRDAATGLHTLRIWRGALGAKSHIVCISAKGDFESNVAFAMNAEAGVEPYDIDLAGLVDGYELSLFDTEGGQRIYHEAPHLIREVRMNTSVLGRTIVHQDSLARRAHAHGDATRFRMQLTTQSHTTRNHVAFDPNGLRNHTQSLRTLLRSELGEQTQDRWMPSTFNAQLEVLDYLNTLMGGETQDAVLVDPFFGETALREFLLRIPHAGLKLTVVTSWGETDPDTGERLRGGSERALMEGGRRLAPLLQRISAYMAPYLTLINLVTSKGGPAFHDRYLFIQSYDGEKQVFLLSNSINGIAVNWPFCVSRLTGRAALDAIRYIQGLTRGYDDTQATTLKISYQWPEPNPPSISP